MKSAQYSSLTPRLKHARILSPTYTENTSMMSPSKSLKTHLNIKSLKIGQNPKEKNYFPQWLLNREDFLNSLTIEDLSLNPAHICTKPNSQRDQMERMALKVWTQDCEFFKHLTDHSANEVRKKLSTVHFSKGETLIKEGDDSQCMYIICSGVAEILKNGLNLSETIAAKNTVGESGIKNNQKRSATVVAKTEISALMLKIQDYDDIVRRQKYREKFEMVDYLKGIKFFSGFFGSKLETIAYNLFTMQYFSDQIIYSTNEEALNFYIIREGSVRFEKTVMLNLKSRYPGSQKSFIRKRVYTKVIRECSSGEFFGEEEIISNENRKSSAICSSDKTIIWILKKNAFMNVFSERDKQMMADQANMRPDTADLKQKVKNEFMDEVLRVDALMDATHLSPMPIGRVDLNRRNNIINGIIKRHKNKINQQLQSERVFIE